MIIRDINKMDLPMGNLNQEYQLLFHTEEQFPVFMRLSDDLEVSTLGKIIYDFGLRHIGECIKSNMTDSSGFMFSINPIKLEIGFLHPELAKLKDILYILKDTPMMEEFKKMNKPICIAVSTETTGRAINMTWINDSEIRFDVEIY